MRASSHPVIVEYAVRECFKHRTPARAAAITKEKLAGSTNLFVGGGSEIVEIDETVLEAQIWLRMAARAVSSLSRMKPGSERFAVEATLQEFGQKVTPKNITLLESIMVELVGAH